MLPWLLKGQQPRAADEKGFGDLLPIILPLLAKGQAAPDKGWLDDALRVATVVVPLLKSQQGAGKSMLPMDIFSPTFPWPPPFFLKGGAGGQDKDVLGDVLRVISVVGPLLKGQGQPAQKGWTDLLPLIPILLA